MEKKEKILIEEDKADNAVICCPHCNSDQIWRIERTVAEKIACYLSNGKFSTKKYLCNSCQGIILVHRNNIEYDKVKIEAEQSMISIVPCQKCDFKRLQISEVSPSDEVAYRTATGKTAFRKLTCLNCDDETIISNEDYTVFNRNEF